HADGLLPVKALFETGLLYPLRPAPEEYPLADFDSWLNQSGVLEAEVFAHPQVVARAGGGVPELPDLGIAATGTPRVADGLEWPVRLAVAAQL
ncbi:hypothetical protein ACTGYH_12900, partial [Streptococcus suis]